MLLVVCAIGFVSYKVYDVMYYKNTAKVNKENYEVVKSNNKKDKSIIEEWKDAISKEANKVKKQIKELTE